MLIVRSENSFCPRFYPGSIVLPFGLRIIVFPRFHTVPAIPDDTTEQMTPTASDSQVIMPQSITESTNQNVESAAATATSVAESSALRPLTDEETIQSLVEGGMDPSFLDALPEDMRSEVIADHRHARQVQQRLSSINLPEHINSDWLAGLPPHIQEEVSI